MIPFLFGAGGAIGLRLGYNFITGTETTQRHVVEAGLIGVVPGTFGAARGLGVVGYRLFKGRKIVQAYKPGMQMHSVSNVGTRLGVGQSITSNISKREAYQNMLIYSAVGGTPAARGMIAAGVISKSLDVIYGTKTSQPSTETQRRKSSRKVGRRGAQKKRYQLPNDTRGHKIGTRGPCAKGYVYRKINGKHFCVKR